jgi:POT family proton-dependent oligopeptide transporter
VATDARAVAVAPTARFANDRDFLGHPRGLLFIGCTELWERISFHGMQALLVLYMVERLLLPGHVENIVGFRGFRAGIESVTGPLSSQALASQIFGLYVGFVYLMPVFGGLLGDRVLGRRRAVALGAILMTAGHFCMAFEAWFLAALLLLVAGAGVLRGNLASQVGDLYSSDDRRRETAFQIYYGALNTGLRPVLAHPCGDRGRRLTADSAVSFATAARVDARSGLILECRCAGRWVAD